MYTLEIKHAYYRISALVRFLCVVILTILLLHGIFLKNASAQSSPAVSYTLNTSPNAVNSGELVSIGVSFTSTTEIAGASVTVNKSSLNFSSFQSQNTENLSFVYYYPEYEEIVFICKDNSCPPGTYNIATLKYTAGTLANATLTVKPKETADPNLKLLSATGASITININQDSSSNQTGSNIVPEKQQNIYTIPDPNNSGTITPLKITEQDFSVEESVAYPSTGINDTNNTYPLNSEDKKTSWSLIQVIAFGLSIGAGLGLVMIVVIWYKNKHRFD